MFALLVGPLSGHRGPVLEDYNYDTPIEPRASHYRADMNALERELPHGGARPLPAGGPSQPWYDPLLSSVMSSNTALVGTKSVADNLVPFAYAELTYLDAFAWATFLQYASVNGGLWLNGNMQKTWGDVTKEYLSKCACPRQRRAPRAAPAPISPAPLGPADAPSPPRSPARCSPPSTGRAPRSSTRR